MSLLLDALKKAEKAKEDAKRRADVSGTPDPGDAGSQVRTRNELPDISRPLDINPDDFAAAAGGASSSPVPDAFSTAPPQRQASAVTEPKARDPSADPVRRQRPTGQEAEDRPDGQSAQKAAARKVFEAKFREPNPKLPFYITMAVLGLFSVGTLIYFWYQLRPPAPLINSNPKSSGDEKKLDVPPPQQGADKPSISAVAAPPEISGLPGQLPPVLPGKGPGGTPSTPNPPPATATSATLAPVGTPSRSAPLAESKPSPARTTPSQEIARPAPQAATASPRQKPSTGAPVRAPADSSRVNINRAGPRVDPRIDSAWQAYNEGDLRTARTNYQAMLRDDSMHRDALLGMAAVEIRSNRFEQAAGYYQSLLQVNPRDTIAQAGLLSLRAQMGDTVQAESKVKTMMANDPEALVLHFTLGNQYAQQGRWPEAQQAYFKAYSAEPDNPDFAYNLAVSLDQVRQPKLALEYYRRALSLAQQRASSFDQSLARLRVQELAK